jgi:hypothetical protein
MKTSNDLLTVIALRHSEFEREVLVLKAEGQDFYAFLPGGLRGLGHCKIHFSVHESGEQHMVVESLGCEGEWHEDEWPRLGAEPATMREQTKVQLQRPAALRGAHLLGGCNILAEQFPDLRPVGTNCGELTVLDGEAAHFRDDLTMVRAYLVEPGCEDAVVADPSAGPRIVHFEKRTAPWIAVDLFQLSATSAEPII